MGDDGSDVELEGMDMNDDDDKEDVVIEEHSSAIAISPSKGSTEKQLLREKQDLEAARKERMALVASSHKEANETKKTSQQDDRDDRLAYLLSQSDVFAHFLAGKIFYGFY